MRTMKKMLLVTVFVLSIVLSMFVGCTNKPDDGGKNPGDGDNPSSGFTITYKANADDAVFTDTLDGDDIVYTKIDAGSALNAPAIVRPGYFLNGWGLIQDNPRSEIWNFATNKVSSNLTLYAAWLKLHTITFDYGDATLLSGNPNAWGAKIIDGELIDNTNKDFPKVEKADHIFGGWFTESACTNRWNFYTDTVDKNIKLYAKLTPMVQSTDNPLFSYVKDEESDTDTIMIVKFNHDELGFSNEDIGKGDVEVKIDIPSTLDGKTVTAIGDRAFVPDDINLGSVAVPALFPVYQVAEIKMANTIERMGLEVFMFNHNITKIELSSNLVRLGDYAFMGCQFIDNGVIDLSSYSKLTEIGDGAFMSSGVTSVVLPKTLTYLGEHAFDKSTKLNHVTYKDCAGWNASTMALRLPSTLERLGEYAFASTKLTGSVDIGNLTKLETLERSMFFENGLITSAVLPEGIDGIGTCMFQDATNLRSVNIPSTVKTIGNWILYGTAIEFDEANPLVLPEGLESIGEWNFGETPNCTSIIIPSTVTKMGTYNFSDWTSAMKVNVVGITAKPAAWPSNWSGGSATIVWNFAG